MLLILLIICTSEWNYPEANGLIPITFYGIGTGTLDESTAKVV
jgi:hypothetical protein